MKKLFINILLICALSMMSSEVFAKPSYTASLNRGTKQLNEKKYTPAIKSFTKAVKYAPDNLKTRKGLVKAYVARANVSYTKDKEWGRAANDYRCALFYIEYFNPKLNDSELNNLQEEAEKGLNACYRKLHFKKNCENRFYTAELLWIAGNYTAAAYEYNQSLKIKDEQLKERCTERLKEINKKRRFHVAVD